MCASSVAAELRRCSSLHELHLEHNRLVTPLMDLTHATALASLQVGVLGVGWRAGGGLWRCVEGQPLPPPAEDTVTGPAVHSQTLEHMP